MAMPADVAGRYAGRSAKSPVRSTFMITAKGETFDKVLGLELVRINGGAKPFDASEIVARIKAVTQPYRQASCGE